MDTQFYKGDILLIDRTKDNAYLIKYKDTKCKFIGHTKREALSIFKRNYNNGTL
jgi:hypothetical protein